MNGVSKFDSWSTVKEFLNWLVDKQLEEEKAEYQRVKEVAIEQYWTIGDLKDMSLSSSKLYRIATSEPFRLKDGIVRHFRDEIRRFKPVFRVASELSSISM